MEIDLHITVIISDQLIITLGKLALWALMMF